MKLHILLIVPALFFSHFASAQIQSSGWIWPEDRKTAEEKYVLYTDMFNLNNFKATLPPFTWLLTNAPQLNPSLYINGAKIFENLAEEETDPEKKIVYEDSCLLMFDLRIKYFNEEPNVLNRKAYYAYRFKNSDKSYYQELYDLFNKTFDLNKNNFWDNNLVPYMDVVRRYKLGGGALTDEQILNIYERLTDVIDYKVKQGQNVDKLNGYREQIDDILTGIVKVDCKFIEENMLPKLKSSPEDVKLAKNIFKLAFVGKCTESPAFLESAVIVQKYEPSYGMAKLIGDRCFITEDFQNALKYYKEAVGLTEENTKKAELYLNQSDVYRRIGQKANSRDLAQMCLRVDPSKGDCYTMIGNLYFGSYDDCKQGVNPVEDRAIFIAAYEMYRKAGNSAMMSQARAQFPTMEEIFTYNMELGQPVKVGCWIDEVVTIQKRD
jgi:tetratricopeptide (TPR) repeat protein